MLTYTVLQGAALSDSAHTSAPVSQWMAAKVHEKGLLAFEEPFYTHIFASDIHRMD